MEYHDVVKDFAKRTVVNLTYIKETKSKQSEFEVYEVTQLINSMLGLLIFPQQKYFNCIEEIPVSELKERGWPTPQTAKGFPEAKNLRELVRYMRNAISHFNVKFIANQGELSGLRLWNECRSCRRKTWEAQFELDELRDFTFKFVDLLTS